MNVHRYKKKFKSLRISKCIYMRLVFKMLIGDKITLVARIGDNPGFLRHGISMARVTSNGRVTAPF